MKTFPGLEVLMLLLVTFTCGKVIVGDGDVLMDKDTSRGPQLTGDTCLSR